MLDDVHKQLVLKTIWGDSEVNDGYLDADLWQVVRVGQLGGHQETEVLRIRNGLVTKSHLV